MTENKNIEVHNELIGELALVDSLQRELYIGREINYDGCITIANQIREINREDLTIKAKNPNYIAPPINLYINTFGGDVYGGLDIITAIRQSKTVVNGIVTGTCYSMGVTIFLTCHNRLVSPYANFMVHSVSVESISGSSVLDYKEQLKTLESTQAMIKKIMSEYLEDNSEHELIKALDYDKDYYFNVPEAIEHGIVDEYIENIDLNFLLGILNPLAKKKADTNAKKKDYKFNAKKWLSKIK